jgi:hypothetical protein
MDANLFWLPSAPAKSSLTTSFLMAIAGFSCLLPYTRNFVTWQSKNRPTGQRKTSGLEWGKAQCIRAARRCWSGSQSRGHCSILD